MADETKLQVTKWSYWQPVATDTDGTPLSHGERMIEVEPGKWMDPLMVAVLKYLNQEPTA